GRSARTAEGEPAAGRAGPHPVRVRGGPAHRGARGPRAAHPHGVRAGARAGGAPV
ncbi:MAG: hypothetical protein AVDCRST_MAG66-260, partial [uncultured Pseudonocardia sp.]